MTKEFEDRGNTYTIHESKDIGEVRVADEVVAMQVLLLQRWKALRVWLATSLMNL